MGHVSKLAGGLVLLLCLAPPPAHAAERGGARTVRGVLYFTNNSPPERVYHFKLYTRDLKRVVAAQRPNGTSGFEFRNVRPGRYVLTVTGPYVCDLWYEVDLRRQSQTRMTLFGDADCGPCGTPPGTGRRGAAAVRQ